MRMVSEVVRVTAQVRQPGKFVSFLSNYLEHKRSTFFPMAKDSCSRITWTGEISRLEEAGCFFSVRCFEEGVLYLVV